MVRQCTVIGDATLDVTVQPSGSLRNGGDVPAAIRIGPGGQGANVAVRLARRGVATTLAAPMAEDTGGRWLADALRAEGVRVVPLAAAGSSIVVILLDAGGERSMLSYRQPVPAERMADVLADASWIHVSAYPLLDDRGGDDLAGVVCRRTAGTRLSVAGGSIPPDRDQVSRFRSRLATANPDLLLVNLDEASALLGSAVASPSEAAMQLRELALAVLVTAGSGGSAASFGMRVLAQPATAAHGPMVDSTGAGDAYLATLLVELGPDPWPPEAGALQNAMRRASEAGSQAARVMGAQGRIALEDEPGGR